jgi:hypothetical protein
VGLYLNTVTSCVQHSSIFLLLARLHILFDILHTDQVIIVRKQTDYMDYRVQYHWIWGSRLCRLLTNYVCFLTIITWSVCNISKRENCVGCWVGLYLNTVTSCAERWAFHSPRVLYWLSVRAVFNICRRASNRKIELCCTHHVPWNFHARVEFVSFPRPPNEIKIYLQTLTPVSSPPPVFVNLTHHRFPDCISASRPHTPTIRLIKGKALEKLFIPACKCANPTSAV